MPNKKIYFLSLTIFVLALISVFAAEVKAEDVIWVKQFSTTDEKSTDAKKVAVDSTGVYVAGFVKGILPGQSYPTYQISEDFFWQDAFIRKYDQWGNELWTRQFGNTVSSKYEDRVNDIALYSTDVYVAGYTEGKLPGSSDSGSAFMRKYDQYGNEIWTRQFGAGEAHGIFVDSNGVYVVGDTGFEYNNPGDAFVKKYDFNGNELWERKFGTSGYEPGYGSATYSDRADAVFADNSGIYVFGDVGGALAGQTRAGGMDAFVRKYDQNGNEIWIRQFGSTKNDFPEDISGDSTGIYVVGTTYGTLPGQSSFGDDDAFIKKYDFYGNEIWTKQFGSSKSDSADSIYIDASGIYITGSGGELPGQTSAGSGDAFLIKYDSNGNVLWTKQFGSSASDYGEGIAVDSNGIYVSGQTKGSLFNQQFSGGEDAFLVKFQIATSPIVPTPQPTPSESPEPTSEPEVSPQQEVPVVPQGPWIYFESSFNKTLDMPLASEELQEDWEFYDIIWEDVITQGKKVNVDILLKSPPNLNLTTRLLWPGAKVHVIFRLYDKKFPFSGYKYFEHFTGDKALLYIRNYVGEVIEMKGFEDKDVIQVKDVVFSPAIFPDEISATVIINLSDQEVIYLEKTKEFSVRFNTDISLNCAYGLIDACLAWYAGPMEFVAAQKVESLKNAVNSMKAFYFNEEAVVLNLIEGNYIEAGISFFWWSAEIGKELWDPLKWFVSGYKYITRTIDCAKLTYWWTDFLLGFQTAMMEASQQIAAGVFNAVFLESPASLTITTADGKKIGFDESDNIINEFGEAGEVVVGHPSLVVFKGIQPFEVTVSGKEPGTYNLTIFQAKGPKELAVVGFSNVPAVTQSKATIKVDPGSQDYSLALDENNDGTIENYKKPDKFELIKPPIQEVPPPKSGFSSYLFGALLAAIISVASIISSVVILKKRKKNMPDEKSKIPQNMFCPKCGQQIAAGSQFCNKCSQKISRTLFCPKCGQQIEAGSQFCNKCGQKFPRITISCRKCGQQIEAKSRFCLQCGQRVKLVRWWVIVLAVLIPLLIFIGWSFFSPHVGSLPTPLLFLKVGRLKITKN